jgi:SAM-dependent methyltransferase
MTAWCAGGAGADVKYYVPEHRDGYARLVAAGGTSWDELHGSRGFEDASIRKVLEETLPHVKVTSPAPLTLEYGCGTGAGACLLAERGMRVRGVDLSPVAIALARKQAAARGLDIAFEVADVCAQPSPKQGIYDLIVDAYCMQCIVTDEDRRRLLTFVRAALKASGPVHHRHRGFSTGREYGDSLYDPRTGIEMEPIDADAGTRTRSGSAVTGSSRAAGMSRSDALARELEDAGFVTEWLRVAGNGDLARHHEAACELNGISPRDLTASMPARITSRSSGAAGPRRVFRHGRAS